LDIVVRNRQKREFGNVAIIREVGLASRSDRRFRCLELFRQAGLFQDDICHVPGFDVVINGEGLKRNWAEPYLMVALARPLEIAAIGQEHFFQGWREAVH
jgi:hypothetical protein